MSADVVYFMQVSLDGFMEGPDGTFGWAEPDAEIHAFINARERAATAYLYGRRMYELMDAAWPAAGDEPDASDEVREFARVYEATPKIVFSTTLEQVGSNSRLVRADAAEEVRRLKASEDGELHVGGAGLAGSLLRAGVVDEVILLVYPVLVGGGKRALPPLDAVRPLSLAETCTFGCGAAYLRYRVAH